MRQSFAFMQRCENELLRRTTIAESMAELEQLCREFGPHLRSWQSQAQAEDLQHLSELQRRLALASKLWSREQLGKTL